MKLGYRNKFVTIGEKFVNTEFKCLGGDSKITIQEDSGNIREISLEELYILEQENLVQ